MNQRVEYYWRGDDQKGACREKENKKGAWFGVLLERGRSRLKGRVR